MLAALASPRRLKRKRHQRRRRASSECYPGQYFDAESGLHYNYFRDYEPGTGRYVESDPIGLRGGVATYGYVDSSPLGSTDSLGLINDNAWPSPNQIQREFESARRSQLAMGELTRTYEEMLNKSVRGTDQFYHCLGACRASKVTGDPQFVIELMQLKELRDYSLNLVGQYGDRRLTHAEMIQDIGRDMAVNEMGAMCPSNIDCVKRCAPLLDGLPQRRRKYMTHYRPDWKRP